MDQDILIRKLDAQEIPTVLFTDVDGTLFSPNFNILTAPLINIQTSAFLKKSHIPFIIVTGRSFWRRIDQYHLKLLGVPKPDAVVTANGSIIYYLDRNGYVSDFTWQGVMQSTKVVNNNGQSNSWNKWEITDTITNHLTENHIPFSLGKGNTYLIRIRLNTYPIRQVEQIKKEILIIFPRGIRVILTEKLLWKNTLDTFSGELLITPSTAGKDKAVQHLLKNFSMGIKKPVHAYIFGDATVDIPMLTMRSDPRYYSLSQFAVHPTPLAKKIIKERELENSNLHVLPGDGPKEILWTLRPELRKEEKLSIAQNNASRKVVRIFETFLDKIVDRNLSANEVSFLGLQKLSLGLSLLHKPKASILDKTKGIYHYSFGNLTDILDGIRSRNSNKKEENGQLVDGFSDRAKEFMQLFQRGKKRMSYDENLAIKTFLASLTCALPSIARAEVEITGKTVSERDEKGGSMIDRTKRLFLSLLFDTFGLEDQSVAKDLEIYKTNIATYEHRLPFAKGISIEKVDIQKLSKFQKEALERFLLYVDVLQQEHSIIIKYLTKYPKLLKEYEKHSTKLAKEYFNIPIGKLRKKFEIKDYKLRLLDYI